MPLEKKKGKKAFKNNVKKEVAAGKPIKQAVAIAYSVEDTSKMAADYVKKKK